MSERVVNYGRLAALFNDLELRMLGLGENSRYRRRAVERLDVPTPARVVDVACGTGLNFNALEAHLGDNGRIVGVDISPQMLEGAEKRVARHGWDNVELVNAPISELDPEAHFDGAICTLALEAIPEYRQAIEGVFSVLKPGGKFAVIGMQPSSRPLLKLMNPFVVAMGKLGGLDYRADIIGYLRTAHEIIYLKEFMGGFFYILVAQ